MDNINVEIIKNKINQLKDEYSKQKLKISYKLHHSR